MKKENELKNETVKYALIPENLYRALIATLSQLPVEPFGERAILMLRDLRGCKIIEDNVEQLKEK